MSVIIFIVLLALLILVHELGHFLAAKSVGARVDEFGIGFPPRLYAWKREGSETTYSINWIPFGGFVKIYGENGQIDSPEDTGRSLASKSRLGQAWVLAAGVIFNTILAWLIISIGFMVGFPSVITPETEGVIGTPEVTIFEISPDSPAQAAGLEPGDVILDLKENAASSVVIVAEDVEIVQEFIGASAGEEIALTYERDGVVRSVPIIPEAGIIPDRGAIGVSLDVVGTVQLPIYSAFIQGGETTWYLLKATAIGLWNLLASAVQGDADLSQVSGPIGIIGMVGDAADRGLMILLSFAAVISLNLAIINLVPFPALDGGRLLFLAVESVIRRPLPQKLTMWANGVGFVLLVLLMLIITVSDVVKSFT
jgi:regulator of sigma E protease